MTPAGYRMLAAKDWSIGKARREGLLYEAQKLDGKRVSVDEIVILHNALGLLAQRTPYRNYYCAPTDGPQREACEALARRDLMTKAEKSQPSGNHFFHVTESGAALLGHTLPKD